MDPCVLVVLVGCVLQEDLFRQSGSHSEFCQIRDALDTGSPKTLRMQISATSSFSTADHLQSAQIILNVVKKLVAGTFLFNQFLARVFVFVLFSRSSAFGGGDFDALLGLSAGTSGATSTD